MQALINYFTRLEPEDIEAILWDIEGLSNKKAIDWWALEWSNETESGVEWVKKQLGKAHHTLREVLEEALATVEWQRDNRLGRYDDSDYYERQQAYREMQVG